MDNFRYTKVLEALKNKKWKVIVPTVFLSATLVLSGCATTEKTDENISNDVAVETTTEEVIEESNGFVDAVNDAYEKSMEADTMVQQAITGTMELGKSIVNATDEYRQTETYKEDVARLKTEFDAIVNFLLGKTEINGYTIKDVGSETLETAKDAVSYLDGVIESYIPDYKDKAKEKLSELGNLAWDKATDFGAILYNKGQDFKDEVLEKSKGL